MIRKFFLKLWQTLNLLFPFLPDYRYYEQMRRIENMIDELNRMEYEKMKGRKK